MAETQTFHLPSKLNRYLATLSRMYGSKGDRQLQELIVNAQVRVQEDWDTDNWNGEASGYAVFLIVPESLYLQLVDSKDKLEDRIQKDLNAVKTTNGEYIARVFLDLDDQEDHDWRQASGLLLTGAKIIPPNAVSRIWSAGQFRLFMSHKSEVKKNVATLKQELEFFGISGFVAHEDIHPTSEWQDEIENALVTMDGFVAILTEKFHDSDWTDQEIGYAMARNVPFISIKLDRDPYGFIGKFQALSCQWDHAATRIASILMKHDQMVDSYITRLCTCSSFDEGNRLGELLKNIEKLNELQIDRMIEVYNENSQLRGSYAFNGLQPKLYGDGLFPLVSSFSNRHFTQGDHMTIRIKSKSTR